MNWSLLIQLNFSGYKVEVSFVAICLIIILSIMVGLYSFYKGLIKYVYMMHVYHVFKLSYGKVINDKRSS